MSDTTHQLNSEGYSYLKNNLREHPALKELREATHQFPAAVMQISPEQGQLMSCLVQLIGAQKTIDIGTFTGYSALAVALALPQHGKVITCDISTEWTKIGKSFWENAGCSHKIELKIAPALQILNELLDEGQANTFDFIFIDADKRNYISYYEKSLQLLRPGGLIAVDNVLWDGKVADLSINDHDTVSIRALNEKILADKNVFSCMLPIGDGLTLVRKRTTVMPAKAGIQKV